MNKLSEIRAAIGNQIQAINAQSQGQTSIILPYICNRRIEILLFEFLNRGAFNWLQRGFQMKMTLKQETYSIFQWLAVDYVT